METNKNVGWLTFPDGTKEEMHQGNTSVYRHIGKAALFDHVFVALGENRGIFLWSDNPAYEAVSVSAAEAECILHLNLQEASELDQQTFMKHHTDDLDTVPDWL